MRNSRVLVLFILSLISISCKRAEESETSSITIDTKSFRKVSAQASSWPADSESCFAVDVRGPKISDRNLANSCSVPLGTSMGFVEPGATLTLDVTRGEERELKVYLYKRAANEACPRIEDVFSNKSKLASLYLVGTTSKISMNSENVSVEVSASFPGLANTVASNLSNDQCKPAVIATRNLRVILAKTSTTTSQGTVKLKIRSQGVLK